jgi:hypothetical protein
MCGLYDDAMQLKNRRLIQRKLEQHQLTGGGEQR